MKTKILDINGKEKGSIELPRSFSKPIREDIVFKILETKKTMQPYAPSPVAGKQHSASGILIHRRHVWKSQYGRGISRIPRKIMSKKGSQFNWVGAQIPSAVGGKRAHPPKILAKINTKKLNKKELRVGFESALSASADEKSIIKRYQTLKGKRIIGLPFVVESKLSDLKTKELISSIEKILNKDLFELAIPKKSIRQGRGKMRGRKHKWTAGLLIIIGNKERIMTNVFESVRAKNLTVTDLSRGGLGRLTLYTEQAIKDLGERLK